MYQFETEWIVARSCRFTKLLLRNQTCADAVVREKVLKCTGSTLQVLELCHDDEIDSVDPRPELPMDDIYFDIAMYCPLIREFFLWEEKVTGNLNLLIFKCAHLKHLELEKCRSIGNSTIKAICNAPHLHTLALSEASFESDTTHYSSYTSSSLRKLFADCAQLSGEGFVRLVGCFPFITSLCLGPIQGTHLVTVAQQCVHVKDANIRLEDSLSDDDARALCTHWASIELLQLRSEHSDRAACSEQAVLLLLKGCGALLKLSVCRLDAPRSEEHLYYSKRRNRNMSPTSSNNSLSSLPSNTNSNTTTTSTVAHTSLSPYALPTATTSNTPSNVTDLFVDSLTQAHLNVVLALCPRLNTLAIRHHSKITLPRNDINTHNTNGAAEYVLHLLNTSAVRKLHLSHIHSLSHSDLLPLINLQELQLAHIGKRVTNDTILKVVQNNPNLNRISLYQCQGLSGSHLILPLLQLCPKLHTFDYDEYRKSGQMPIAFSPPVRLLIDVVLYSFPHVKCFAVRF